jgi:heat shock protein HtpX
MLTLAVAYIADNVVSAAWPDYAYDSLPWIGVGFVVVTVITALINYSQYKSQGGAVVATSLGAVQINPATPRPQERQLLNLIEEIALAAGLPMPQVFVLENPQINAFAAGTKPENACICVTTGALRQLDRSELQGVIAHEFGHIYNHDMKLSMRLAAMLMGFYLVFYMALKLFQYSPMRRSSDEGRQGAPAFLVALVLMGAGALSYLAGKILSSLVSQQREYLADASSVQFTRNPEGLINALRKIEKETQIHDMPKEGMAFSHLYFDNRGFLGSLFATHPPLQKRIQALLGRDYLPKQ